jgi:RimJ/RimL family protein N-acetyltransferase
MITIKLESNKNIIKILLEDLFHFEPQYLNLSKYWYFVSYLDNAPIGMIIFEINKPGMVFVHWAFYKDHRGTTAFRSALKLKEIIKVNFKNTCFIGFTPSKDCGIIRLAKKIGFKEVGVLKDSLYKDGQWEDQVITQLRI